MNTEDTQHTEPVPPNGTGIKWVMLIYFCSGVCSLIDEVVWVRLMKLTLGNTVYASSIVVSMFMGGLALGALIMGRYADRVQRRLRLYAIFEVCAAISALSLPWVLGFADGVYRWFFANYQPSPTSLLLVQVIISAAILLVPTMVMGSTLPLLGRYITALQDRVGPLVGRLYALNMLGAAAGCFLAGFVLIRLVGVMGTLYIAAGINMLVALGGWILSRLHDVASESPAQVAMAKQQSADREQPVWQKRYVLISAFFVSGLISIGYELIWMRSIVFLLGGFTYVFSAVLTIYLLGNVVGAWIGSRLSKRLKNPAAGFGVSLTCLGLLGISYIPWLSIWRLKVVPNASSLLSGLLKTPTLQAMVWPLLNSTLLFLLPALTMGIGFPLALQAWSNYKHKVGQTTGTVYGVNTIGAVLGGVVTGFLLIPLMGVQLSITVLAVAGIWLGATMLQVNLDNTKAVWRTASLIIAIALTTLAVAIPPTLFEHQFVQLGNTTLIAVKEGVTTTVSVHEGQAGELTLATSCIRVAGDGRDSFRIPQKILGHLGIFLNKNTKQTLSVGFGAGETAACMAIHNLKHIDAVEIAPELIDVAMEFFRHINLGEQLDEKVNMVYMDAKNYLHLTPEHYDLIVNDCTNPKQVADNASLFTKEYFQSALEHLNAGGIFGSYLPIREIPISCIDSILGTFAEVFPYVTIWFPTTAPAKYDFLYLAGSNQPQLFSPRYIDNELQQETVRDSTAYLNFHNSHYVLSCYIADQDDLKRYLKTFHLNSDFKPYIEFSTDIDEDLSSKKQWLAQFFAKLRSDSIFEHMDWTGLSQNEQNKWLKDHELFYKASTSLLKSRVEPDITARLKNTFDALKLTPQNASLLEQQEQELYYWEELLNRDMTDEIMVIMDTLLQEHSNFGVAWLIKSRALLKKNQIEEALTAAEKAVQYAPYTAAARNNIGVLLQRLGKSDEAVAQYTEAVRLRPTEPTLHYNLAVAFLSQGRLDKAVLKFRQLLQIQPRNANVRFILANTLAKQGRKNEAVREYLRLQQLNPNYPGLRDKINAAMAQ